MQETLKLIREIILNVAKKYNIDVDKVILFGSRARGDYREDSDWDILIVTKEKLDKDLFWEFYKEIDLLFVKNSIIPEIIIIDKDTFEKYKKFSGYVYYWAEKEGISIK